MLDSRVLRVFREVFDDEQLAVSDTTSARDVPDWDSLAQVKLVIALEQEFDVRFSTTEIGTWACVGDLKRALRSKLGAA
ncbi:MAG: acyl carrier protein [Chloroflexi bacterium]|nr:acyl carrier protein [Chloroflexota bacterium]